MTMRYENPFPGMNPYLEDPLIWPGFHNRLIANLADNLGTRVPDNYRVDIEERTEVVTSDGSNPEPTLRRPDVRVTDTSGISERRDLLPASAVTTAAVAEPPENAVAVQLGMPDELRVTYLYVQRMPDWKVVTVVEVLSPANKIAGEGRRNYLHKREEVLASGVSLVEIDLLRGGQPMPLQTPTATPPLPSHHYRILVCRGWERPNAVLYPFRVQQAIPRFTLPLSPEDDEPEVDLGPIVNAMHHRARYAQVTQYAAPPPGPAFDAGAQEWVAERLASWRPAPQR